MACYHALEIMDDGENHQDPSQPRPPLTVIFSLTKTWSKMTTAAQTARIIWSRRPSRNIMLSHTGGAAPGACPSWNVLINERHGSDHGAVTDRDSALNHQIRPKIDT